MKHNWRQKVLSILQLPAIAVGATATTLGVANAVATNDQDGAHKGGIGLDPLVLPNPLNSTAEDLYAAHRSHSSHASHRSSSGGGVAIPRTAPSTPTYTRPSTPSPTYQPPQTQTAPSTPKPSAADISGMVVRVQAALMRLGYFNGDIDGVLGPQTRSSLTKYQKDKGLSQTGRMDIETLTALGISIP